MRDQFGQHQDSHPVPTPPPFPGVEQGAWAPAVHATTVDRLPPPAAQPVDPLSASRYPVESWGRSTIYRFDGGAATYFGTALLATLVTVLTLGICLPFALVLFQRWRAKHTLLLGQRLRFTGSATHLFGLWIKWWLLCIVTLGIYGFWVGPRLMRWVVEHTDIDPDAPREALR